jgi:hypothetical protein
VYLRNGLVIFLALGSFAFEGLADTLTFPDGSKMDGAVREVNENCVELTVGENTIQFQRTEIASIEKNTKKGDSGKPLVLPMVQQWQDQMDAATGMNADQRENLFNLINVLRTAQEPVDRHRIEEQIVVLNKSADVVKFVKASYDHSTIGQKMALLDVLNLIEPAAAVPMLEEAMVTNNAPFRAYAIRLYEKTKLKSGRMDRNGLSYLARGILDSDVDVQLAAGIALAECGQKPVTPVLISQLNAADLRVGNAMNQALARIWNVDSDSVPRDRAAFWQDHWRSNAAAVNNPLNPDALQPLVDKDAPIVDTHH